MTFQLSRRSFIIGAANAVELAVVAHAAPLGATGAKVRMTTGLRATSHSIAWIGTEAGVFRKHGVDASFPRLEVGGLETTAGLRRRDWEFAQTGTLPVAESKLQGGDAVILLRNTTLDQVGLFIMTRPEFTSLGELAGRRIGVLVPPQSGQSSMIAQVTLEKAGVSAVYVSLGTYRNIYEALAAAEVDAGILPIDFRFLGQRHGWNSFETVSFNVPSIFATTRRMIASDRDLVLRVVRGFVETIHLFKTCPEVVAPLLQRYLKFDDRKSVDALCRFYAPLFPTVPRPDVSGMQVLREALVSRYPAARQLQEPDIVDSSIIDEVEQSGFIRQLYAGG